MAQIWALVLIFIVASSGCDANTSPLGGEPEALLLDPGAILLDEGESAPLRVIDPSRESGQLVDPRYLVWESADPTVALVQQGLVRGVGVGTTKVTARTGTGIEAEATVEVARLPRVVQNRTGTGLSGVVGRALDGMIELQVVNGLGYPVPGAEVRFRAVSGGGTASPVQAAADAAGIVRTRWTLGPIAGEQELVVEVLQDSGVRTAIQAIAAPGEAYEVRVVPAQATLQTGKPFQFRAHVVDAFGNRIQEISPAWSSTDPTVLEIDAGGWANGIKKGSAEIEADAFAAGVGLVASVEEQLAQSPGQRRGKAHVEVTDEDGESLVIFSVEGGDGQVGVVGQRLGEDLQLRLTDSNGTPLRQVDVHWSPSADGGSLSSSVVRTNGQGRASVSWTLGTVAGTFTTEARLEGHGAVTFSATGLAGDVAAVHTIPGHASVEVEEELVFAATAVDEFGNEVTSHDSPGWAVENPSVANIDEAGRVRGVSSGTTTVEASVKGVRGTAIVDVQSSGDDGTKNVESVEASASEVVFDALNATKALEAVAYDEDGNTVSDVPFDWVSTNPEVATVDQNGLMTSKAAGLALIVVSAACCDSADSVAVTVEPLVAEVQLTPGSASMGVGESQQFVATALDAGGSPVSGVSVSWASTNESVSTVDYDGLVEALTDGVAEISASVTEGTQSGESVQVAAIVEVESSSPPSTSGVESPELPREWIRWAPPVVTGNTLTVSGSGSLQTAINSAEPGDEIVLSAGAQWNGTITLPKRSDDGWITIRCGDCSLPAYGDRISKAQADALPQIVIQDQGSAPGLRIEETNGWWITGISVVAAGSSTGEGIAINSSGRIALDRVAVIVPQGVSLRRGIRANGAWIEVVGARIEGVNSPGSESQAVAAWTGPGPLRVHNSFLEAASIGFLTGGAHPAGGIHPADIEFTRNHVYKRTAWFGQSGFVVKNAFELKNSKRVLVEGNVFENVWPDAQLGFAILLKSVEQGGSGCPTCQVADVTFRLNRVDNVAHFLNLHRAPEGNPLPMSRILVEDVVVDRLGPQSEFGVGGRGIMLLRAPDDIILRRLTFHPATHSMIVSSGSGVGLLIEDWATSAGTWGVHFDGGGDFSTRYGDSWSWSDVWMVRDAENGCRNAPPEGTTCVESVSDIPQGVSANAAAVENATAGVRDTSRP